MAYYADLSKHSSHSKALKVGWLDGTQPFETTRPAKWLIEKLWTFCKCSLLHSGGFHECNLFCCPGPARKAKNLLYHGPKKSTLPSDVKLRKYLEEGRFSADVQQKFTWFLKVLNRKYIRVIVGTSPNRFDPPLPLGSAQIFVFGERGKIYVAPNMIYHYVTAHRYKPPEEFICALKHGPCPPDPEYVDRLVAVGFLRPYVEAFQKTSQSAIKIRAPRQRKISSN